MQVVNSEEIKKIKQARKLIDDQQQRIWQLESALDDLARATEIAQYSQQYHVVETYRQAAETLLQDRLTVPDFDQSNDPMKIRVYENSDSVNQEIAKRAKQAAGIND
jgi:hypothetical protein